MCAVCFDAERQRPFGQPGNREHSGQHGFYDSQAQSDRTILAKQLGISEHQLSYITHSNSGEGLLFYGNVTIPFVDRFPRGEIYDLLTTRPEDMKNETKNE